MSSNVRVYVAPVPAPRPRVRCRPAPRAYMPSHYRAYVALLTIEFRVLTPLTVPCAVTIVFGMDAARDGADIDNMAKGVLDALVHAHIVPDDSVRFIRTLHCYVAQSAVPYIDVAIAPTEEVP